MEELGRGEVKERGRTEDQVGMGKISEMVFILNKKLEELSI